MYNISRHIQDDTPRCTRVLLACYPFVYQCIRADVWLCMGKSLAFVWIQACKCTLACVCVFICKCKRVIYTSLCQSSYSIRHSNKYTFTKLIFDRWLILSSGHICVLLRFILWHLLSHLFGGALLFSFVLSVCIISLANRNHTKKYMIIRPQ